MLTGTQTWHLAVFSELVPAKPRYPVEGENVMTKTSLWSMFILSLAVLSISACGGGSSATPTSAPPTTAVLTLSTSVSTTIPSGTTINSYDVSITLPIGVTVSTVSGTGSPLETAAGVVTAAGNATGSSIIGTYTAPTGTTSGGTVKVYLANVNTSFAPGVFCTVTGHLAAGVQPSAANFAMNLDDATGLDSTMTSVDLTGDLHLTGTVALR